MKCSHKLLSLILTICTAVSMMLTGFIPTNAVSENKAAGSETFELPDIVDSTEAKENDYVGRVEAEEKDLYTFVFANGDGTNTMRVYSHPVKYIADDNSVRDISLDIKAKKDGGFVTADHEIVTTFENKLSDGITLEYNDVEIMLVPTLDMDAMPAAELSTDGKVVTYEIDDITSFVYKLTYAGFKEDIVVEEYTGQTEYEFTLFTDGLTLREEYGSYYLADAEGNIKALIGDIIVFTADERNNTIGSITYETVRANQEYILTIHLDAEYLADKDTIYPIRIDPTIEINYDNNGAGAIEDVTINQSTTFSGTLGSLYVGRNPVGSLSRTLMRFPKLSLSGIQADLISSATVELRDLMCQSDEDITVECYMYSNTAPTWSESGTTTWTSVGSSYIGTFLDSKLISFGKGNVEGQRHRYAFNITPAVKSWANGSNSPQKGIVFKANNSFENQTGSNIKTWYKTFSSYNRVGEYSPSLSISYSAFTEAENIGLNSIKTVNIASAGAKIIYKFIPSSTGFYTFESSNISSGDPEASLYNSDYVKLTSDDDGAGSLNFRLTYHLLSHCTYYLVAGCYGTKTGCYNVRMYATTISSSIKTTSLSWGDSKYVLCNEKNKVALYKFTPSQSDEYLFFSSEASGDPKIWLYNSSLTLLGSNDDSAGNYNFRLSASLVSGQTYYIVAGEFGTKTGSYCLYLAKAANVSNAVYYLRNAGTLKYMDIDGPEAQEWVHQWSAHTGLQEKWTLQKQSDGYYTIKAEYGNKYYVGISTTSIGENNIKLYSTVSNVTKWKIYSLNSKQVIIEPKTAIGKILYVPTSSTGKKLQLSNMGISASNRNQWEIVKVGRFFAQVYNYFDNGFSVYHNESNTTSRNIINGYIDEIATRYYNLFGLTMLYDNSTYYKSPIDTCKGTITSSNINTLCNHTGTIHTDRNNVISSFKNSFSGSNTITNVLWSCHRIASTATNGNTNYNRSCSSGTSIMMLERSNTTDRERNAKGVLMHELNHQYGARDHYHELTNNNDPNSCKFKDICSQCGNNPRPSSCIMNNSRINISNTDVLCSACKNDIFSHLLGHHSN